MGPAADDFQLLQQYARTRDHAAFGEVARRYVNVVYAAALRRVGDRHLAEDVTQAVFVILATKPASVRAGAPLSAWLLTTVRYAAANAIKMQRRRRKHEGVAAEATAANGAASANPADVLVWQEMAAQLDDAVLKLPAADRRAILLRYFEQRPIRDVAEALNVSEGATKQRLSRSLEKLRHRLTRRGATFAPAGAASLAALLGAHAVVAAPAGLASAAASISASAAGAAAASFTIAKGAITMMTWTKIKTAAAVLAVASVVGTGTAVTLNRARAQDATTTSAAPANAAVRAASAARVTAAERVIAMIEQRVQAAEPMTLQTIEVITNAQRNLATARIDDSQNRAGRIRAAEQYVQACRQMYDLIDRRHKAGTDATAVEVAKGAYHVADAEYLLATLQAAK